jgi:hypothetical protein
MLKQSLICIGLSLSVFMSLTTHSSSADAKNLTNRLGVGMSNKFSFDMPSLAAQYYPNSEFGFTAALGVDTRKDNSLFGIQGGVRRMVFAESNLNFYMGGSMSIVSVETAGNSESGFELNGVVGAEFFLSGLENLGFNFETGIGVASLKSGTRFRTLAYDPFHAGVIFYF